MRGLVRRYGNGILVSSYIIFGGQFYSETVMIGSCFQVYFESDEVHACIVTCGGLCPGLNTVIREIVCGLYHMYGVTRVLGIEVSVC